MSKWLSSKRRESGAALLTVLLMLTVMSAVAVSLLDDIRFDIRRSVNTLYDQAFWFALGGEEFALDVIRQSDNLTPGRNTMLSPWARGPVRLPLDDGAMEATVRDGGNCFNLNSVVNDEDDTLTTRETGVEQYRNLLQALGFNENERERLAFSLSDWIDSDGTPGPRGAEDYHYAALNPSYRTAGVLIADVTELRAIAGYDQPIYRTIRPYVCALPTAELSPLNINLLREDQAPLLTMLVGNDRLAVDSARDLIARRPYDGYSNIDDFWADDAFGGFEPDDDLQGQVGLQTRYFDLRIEVNLDSAYFAMTSLIQRRDQDFALAARSYGIPE